MEKYQDKMKPMGQGIFLDTKNLLGLFLEGMVEGKNYRERP